MNLNADTYWFAVVPTCTECPGDSYNTNSLHAVNAVGTQISNAQYFNSPDNFGANFDNPNNRGGVYPSFSSGVYADAVPEPSSIIMLASGVLTAMGMVRRRMSS